MKNKCLKCQQVFFGRSDKRFCSVACKNAYHNAKRKNDLVHQVDASLHRNRFTLERLFSDNQGPKVLSKEILKDQGFLFEYATQIEVTPEGELIRVVYDYSWKQISDHEILVQKVKDD